MRENTGSVLLYDGNCRFCTKSAHDLRLRTHPDALTIANFQDPAVLERYPQVTHSECMKEAKLIVPSGKVYGGANAIVRALLIRRWWLFPILGWALIPPFSFVARKVYERIAKRRYEIFAAKEKCENDTCSVHFQ